MFVPIFVAVLIAIGLVYVLLKSKTTPLEAAKANYEKSMKTAYAAFETATFAGTTFDPTGTVYAGLISLLVDIHKEFGVTLVPQEEFSNGFVTGVDMNSLEFKWISCPQDQSIDQCWGI